MVERLSTNVLEKRRFYMKAVIDVIIFLTTNEIALRGNWNIDSRTEEGIFRNLVEFKLKDNVELQNCAKIMPKNATYLSPDIQKELIAILAIQVR